MEMVFKSTFFKFHMRSWNFTDTQFKGYFYDFAWKKNLLLSRGHLKQLISMYTAQMLTKD